MQFIPSICAAVLLCVSSGCGNVAGDRPSASSGSGQVATCDAHHKPRSHDTSRIAWAKLMARVGEEFPLECPNCGGDIRP